MWNQISKYFKELPAQEKVAKLLFERGFQVKQNGKVVSGGIEIPHSQIAKEAGVERRAVDNTVATILSESRLSRIFLNLKQIYSLQEVAREFNLGVIIFVPENARQAGIIAEVTKRISEKGLSIRQAFAEDPGIGEHPTLTLIIEGEIPPELIDEIRRQPGTRSVTLY
jgi:predicted regulator of amino acid metabolism with ACT domain